MGYRKIRASFLCYWLRDTCIFNVLLAFNEVSCYSFEAALGRHELTKLKITFHNTASLPFAHRRRDGLQVSRAVLFTIVALTGRLQNRPHRPFTWRILFQ